MTRKRRPARWVPVAIAGAAILAALVGVWMWARHIMSEKPKQVRQVPQVVQLIRPPQDTPPPPPPPPPEKEEEPIPQDQPTPDQTPDAPSQQLGLDADASAGSDAFGLAARRGGADLVGTGTAIFGHYTSLVKEAIQDVLEDEDSVRHGNYSVKVRLWVEPDGTVKRAELVQGTGKQDVDLAYSRALSRLRRLTEAPPLEMPQPMLYVVKVGSRG